MRAGVCVAIITICNIIYNMRHHGKVTVVAVAMSTASEAVEQIKGVSSMWTVFNDDYLYLYSLSKQPNTLRSAQTFVPLGFL